MRFVVLLLGAVALGTVDAVYHHTLLDYASQVPLASKPSPDENLSIFQQLNLNSEFSKLVKAINATDKALSLLNDSSASITFFAVPDRALHMPHRSSKLPLVDDDIANLEAPSLSEIISLMEDFDSISTESKPGLKKILEAIIAYHILPSAFDLSSNTTFPTNLTLPGAIGDEPQRIKVQQTFFPPTTAINLRSLVGSQTKAKNGLIYVIDHPLLPPLSLFNELFIVSSQFSIFTSALLNSELKDDLQLRFGKDKFEGSTAVTVFAPSNFAFLRLPKRLRLFLFSPFGARALKKLLQYHIVPGHVLHSDYLYNATLGGAGLPSVGQMHSSFEEEERFDEFTTIDEVLGYGTDFRDLDEFLPGGRLRPTLMNNGVQMQMPSYPWIEMDKRRIVRICMQNGTFSEIQACIERHEHYPFDLGSPIPRRPTLISSVNLTLPSLLENHTQHVQIARYNVSRPFHRPGQSAHIIANKVSVNGRRISVTDIVGMNGALHVTSHLLDPRPWSGHPLDPRPWSGIERCVDQDHGEDWADWEEWLPSWADED